MLLHVLLCALISLLPLSSSAATTNGFFFFGDSLTDSGYQNNNPTVKKEGKTPRWTSPHGQTWAYYFLENYAQHSPHYHTNLIPNNVDAATFFHPVPTHITPILDGNNFAAGGATTKGAGIINTKAYKSPSLIEQTDYFVNIYAPKHRIAISKHTYMLWSGTNDLMKRLVIEIAIAGWLQKMHLSKFAAAFHLFDLKTLSSRFTKAQTQISDNLLSAVNKLQQAGAKKIVVILLPDIGDTPLINLLAEGLQKKGSLITAAQLSAEMHPVSYRTNTLIRRKLAGSQVLLVDVNHLLQPVISMQTPGHFHETSRDFGKQRRFLITNNKNSACLPTQQALTCIPTAANARHYVFEDVVHPTDQTHQIIGDYVYYQAKQYFHW